MTNKEKISQKKRTKLNLENIGKRSKEPEGFECESDRNLR
jgi:hypothetical protein